MYSISSGSRPSLRVTAVVPSYSSTRRLTIRFRLAKSSALHEAGELVAVLGDRRRHRLGDVVDVGKAGGDNRAAQFLETRHVERDVVVDQEDRARASLLRIGNVVEHARD